ncbi:MAG: AI-2E family transporter [Planctomycetota bacterium]
MFGGDSSWWQRTTGRIRMPWHHAVKILTQVTNRSRSTHEELQALNVAIGALFLAVLRADGQQTTEELARIDQLFAANFGKREARRVQQALVAMPQLDVVAHCRQLTSLSSDEVRELLRGMIEVAFVDGGLSPDELSVVRLVAREFKLSDAVVDESVSEVRAERNKRSTFVRSSAGILIALVVIAIFIFTATFLKSVLFGLILAYFCLPLQRWFQTRFFPHPRVRTLLQYTNQIGAPFRWISTQVKSRFLSDQHAHSTIVLDEHERLLRESCHATMLTVFIGFVIAGTGLVYVSAASVASVREFVVHAQVPQAEARSHADDSSSTDVPGRSNIRSMGDADHGSSQSHSSATRATSTRATSSSPSDSQTDAADEDMRSSDEDRPPEIVLDPNEPLGGGIPWLEQYRPDLAEIPLLRMASEMVEEYLTDPEKKKELMLLGLHNLQPIVMRAGGVLTTIATLLLDGMLTLFFFSFFLNKIAAGQSNRSGRQKPTGQYIVEAIFESGWLPDTSATALREAQIIIDDVILMLQTWVKGYVWIIMIETVIYTVLFWLLRVPYYPVLGLLAGMTILLPFIGPIVGCSLTVVITFALQSQSVTLALVIILIYFVVHGVIEQLILYPGFVGEALGLNALETIIVVLLGGVLAGLAGVIFAVPAAAILKYLVPKIYESWSRQAEDRRASVAVSEPG